MIKNNEFSCRIKIEKMYDNDTFAERLYKLSSWLNKRYKLKCKNVDFSYHFIGTDIPDDTVTIKLKFN